MTGAATKKAKRKPPLGLVRTATPDAPPAKTRNPSNPIKRYNITVINACCGFSNNEITLIIIVCAVTIVGVNGNGNDKYDDTLSKPIQIAIFVKSFVFITIPHFLIRKSPNNQRFV